MSRVRYVPSAVAAWKGFEARDATHKSLVDLSQVMDTSVCWLHRREATEHRPLPSQSGLYRIEPGQFDFESPGDQTSYVVEGEARVELEDGQVLEARAGDMVFYPVGTCSRWTVIKPFVEFFTMIG
jgi:uncharacterized cupin superfamily protein